MRQINAVVENQISFQASVTKIGAVGGEKCLKTGHRNLLNIKLVIDTAHPSTFLSGLLHVSGLRREALCGNKHP